MLSKKLAAIPCAVGLDLYSRYSRWLDDAGYLQAEKQRIIKINERSHSHD